MLRFAPLLLALAYGLVVWHFSARRTARELDARSSELADPGLKPCLDRLARALEVPRIRVHLYEVAPVNGLAAPDGRIFITRGFYDLYRAGKVTGEELTSVIAHELGHVALGHSRRRMIDFSGQNAIRVALASVLGRFLPFVGPWLAGIATSLLAAHLSRADEFEADEYASALMIKAGFGVGPQKSLLARLPELAGGSSASPPAWLMSHPKTEARIKAIEANAARWLN